MTVRRLLNADALFALILGLVLLLNGLLGPRFPFGASIAAVVGLLLLVASVFLGQGGMGKGPLTTRVRMIGLMNMATTVLLGAYALIRLNGAARSFMLVVGLVTAIIGTAQLCAGPSVANDHHDQPDHPVRSGHRRASPAELRAAIGRTADEEHNNSRSTPCDPSTAADPGRLGT